MIYLNTDKDPINKVKIPIHSDAYLHGVPTFIKKNPDNYGNMLSTVHKIIYQTKHQPNVDEVFYARINQSYLDELVLLHREWFPIYYDRDYFKKFCIKKNYIAIGAFVKLYGNDYLIGCCLGELVTDSKFRENVKGVLFDKGMFDYFSPSEVCGYINTLGIIDEYRKLGIGSKLMNKVVNEMKANKCVAMFLHVIEHNKSAINFYEKNKWTHAGIRKNYYFFDNTYFDAEVFYFVLMENVAFQNVVIGEKQQSPYQSNSDPQSVFIKKGCFQTLFSKIKRLVCCCSKKSRAQNIPYGNLVDKINNFN